MLNWFTRKRARTVKWVIIGVVIAFVVTIFASWGAQISTQSRAPFAVKVNGEKISFDALDRVTTARESQNEDLDDTGRRRIYREAVKDLIRDVLAQKEAEERRYTPAKNELIRAIQTYYFSTRDGRIDYARFENARRQAGTSQWLAIERDVRRRVEMEKMVRSLTSAIVVPEASLRNYFDVRYQRAKLRHILIRPSHYVPRTAARIFYESHPDSFIVGERVHGRHILFPLPPNPTEQDRRVSRGRAEALVIQLQSGIPFDRLFRRYQADTSGTVIAEDLGWFGRGRMVPAFDTYAFNWPVGKPTEIIRTRFGYHVALFDAREPAHRKAFEEVEDQIRAALAGDSEIESARRQAERLHRLLEEKGPDAFPEVARKYSDGESAEDGGLLGFVTPGEMTNILYPDSSVLKKIALEIGVPRGNQIIVDPEITRQIFDLPIGTLSPVVRSAHGFHILRIEERKPADPELWDELKTDLANEYRQLLGNEIYRNWLDSRMKNADIEYSRTVKRQME
ncbi:MAG: hypothetical protein D6679_01280 [Candidatus Hydrogenedentota bacterium]|nr:MAG: hypothetical protein D6679_01280 [Candidatus Hydrogenedentota bacterium]